MSSDSGEPGAPGARPRPDEHVHGGGYPSLARVRAREWEEVPARPSKGSARRHSAAAQE
jgi:hypothetical protein